MRDNRDLRLEACLADPLLSNGGGQSDEYRPFPISGVKSDVHKGTVVVK
jgi:hypothetical protein